MILAHPASDAKAIESIGWEKELENHPV